MRNILSSLSCCYLLLLHPSSVSGFSSLQSSRALSLSTASSSCHRGSFANPNAISASCHRLHHSTSYSKLSMSDSSTATAAAPNKKGLLSKLKSAIPTRAERKKLLPLASMFFFILFNYTILRDTKDVLMVTAKKSGAEVIPFIKTYVNLPAAIGFTALYSKLCDRMEQRDVFYTCTVPFLVFFLVFAWVLFPNVDLLHPHLFVVKIASRLPAGAAAPLAIVRWV